jgi:hypothetical protein
MDTTVRTTLPLLLLSGLLANCSTGPAPIFWNKPDFVRAEYDRDAAACQMEKQKAWMSGINTGGYFGAQARRETAEEIAVNCMLAKGYVKS